MLVSERPRDGLSCDEDNANYHLGRIQLLRLVIDETTRGLMGSINSNKLGGKVGRTNEILEVGGICLALG